MTAPRTATRRRLPHSAARRLACLALLSPLAALSACSSSSTPNAAVVTSNAALPACTAPADGGLPHTAGSLTQTDTGAYCLGVGKILDIFLTAPAGSAAGWSEIRIKDTTVLAYGNNGVMTAMRGETPGVVVGRARGVSTVTSTLPDGRTWTATIVVS
ncbi:hypothetical protein KDK95_33310 [Actinospica sp. MGRD01-02]|uniref:Lipoprotein n=1 Tax=Actinospica acidithermotolerans TaxID=2828514 RepID=A0A941EI49_9ACTN|nr:hypothetical protein [Actinospica acidithermotolerans]MBR7831233.1 hypothetical protein [Actinospica acidithermotolerans]